MLISLVNPKNLGQIEEELTYASVEELAAIITEYDWAPAVFSNRKRTISNMTRLDLMVLDVDDGCTLEEAKERFSRHQHIIATSRNHQKEKNGVTADRFRVILFLNEPILDDKDYKQTWMSLYRAHPFIDEACKDSARFFYASPEVVSLKTAGMRVIAEKYVAPIAPVKVVSTSSVKGDLWKSTLEFLTLGAPAGGRHQALVAAVGNMREQGYDQAEVIEMVTNMSESTTADWTQPGLNEADLKTIERMFSREMKYEFKEKEAQAEALYVKADELLSETFDYLSDKDKVKGEPTGIDGLDKLLGGGFRTGELTVLMAQAKTGKNTFYHYLMYKHLQRGIPFGYASRELNPATEVIPNLLSIATASNAWKSDVSDSFRSVSATILSAWPLYFAPGYGHFKLEEIEKWFISLKAIGVNHFLFDHFHYALEKEDYDATASLIKQLKSITKKLDIHLNLIVQPRSLREGETLSLATLRGGAAIGQALDNLLILERVKGQENISKLTMEVARHKLAKLGTIYLKYDSETTTLEEVAKELVQETRIPQGAQMNRFGRANYYAD